MINRWIVEYACDCEQCRRSDEDTSWSRWSRIGCTPRDWYWLARLQAWLLKRKLGGDGEAVTRVVRFNTH